MARSSFSNKIAGVFEKGNPEYEYAGTYLVELRTSWRENERGITRSSTLIVGLAVIFELALNNKTSATLFGIQITSTNVLRFSLIVIVAYLWYGTIFSFIESEIFFSVHSEIIKKVYPALYGADGERQLSPANSMIGSVERVTSALKDRTMERNLAVITGALRPILIVIAPPVYIGAAYVQLFVKYGLSNGLLWGSFAISGILLIAGCSNVYLLALIVGRKLWITGSGRR